MTTGVTKDWVKQQAAKASAPVREGWHNGALTIFVPGTPRHYKGKGNRYTVSRHTKDWRERTAGHLFPHTLAKVTRVVAGKMTTENRWPWRPADPKRIAFTVYTSGRGFDGDNLELVASPARDALKDMRLIDDDGNPAHQFSYEQVTKAKVVGIAIRVALL